MGLLAGSFANVFFFGITALDAPSPMELAPDSAPPSIGLHELPFGTFLVDAAVFVRFFGEVVLEWYSGFLRW